MKKKWITGILAGAVALAALSGCGGAANEAAQEENAAEESTEQENAAEETAQETATEETAEEAPATGTIKVAATAVPHAEILEEAKVLLKEQGIDLEITVFDDYVQPNLVVNDGDLDANYFQHQPYLDQFNEENGTDLVAVGHIHYEPLGIYAGKSDDLAAVEDGVTIAVPNDTTNEARALQLLEANGLIKLKEGVGLNATKLDVIAEESHNAEIVELDASQVSKHAEEVDFMVLNGNYAMEAGLNAATDALAYELSDSDAAKTYVNVVAVKPDRAEDAGIKALVDVLKSDEIAAFIEEKYQGSVVVYTE